MSFIWTWMSSTFAWCPKHEMKLCAADPDDLDEITDVICTAMPGDPQWNYRMPRRQEYPQDTWRCTRKECAKVLSNVGKSEHRMNIVTVPWKEGTKARKIIAVAVWDLVIQSYELPHDSCNDRRDADFKRMKLFIAMIMKAKTKLFDDVYGNHQLHLGVLCTLPDYQRQGAGTMHCKWGLDLAKQKKQEVTLFASPMGKLLYKHLGFKSRGTVIVQVDGEKERLTIEAMAFDTPGIPRKEHKTPHDNQSEKQAS